MKPHVLMAAAGLGSNVALMNAIANAESRGITIQFEPEPYAPAPDLVALKADLSAKLPDFTPMPAKFRGKHRGRHKGAFGKHTKKAGRKL